MYIRVCSEHPLQQPAGKAMWQANAFGLQQCGQLLVILADLGVAMKLDS